MPEGTHLEQADGTAWMGFYCIFMLKIALELAHKDSAYEDVASKFFEHFISIADAMNNLGGSGLWDDQEGFYFDKLKHNEGSLPLKIRSLVGVVPFFAIGNLLKETMSSLPG